MAEQEVGYFKIEEKALRADKIHAKTLEEVKNFLNQSNSVKEGISPETMVKVVGEVTKLAEMLATSINEKVAAKKFGLDNIEMSDDAYVQELGKMASKKINDAIKTFISDATGAQIGDFLKGINSAIITTSKVNIGDDRIN